MYQKNHVVNTRALSLTVVKRGRVIHRIPQPVFQSHGRRLVDHLASVVVAGGVVEVVGAYYRVAR